MNIVIMWRLGKCIAGTHFHGRRDGSCFRFLQICFSTLAVSEKLNTIYEAGEDACRADIDLHWVENYGLARVAMATSLKLHPV